MAIMNPKGLMPLNPRDEHMSSAPNQNDRNFSTLLRSNKMDVEGEVEANFGCLTKLGIS